VIEVQHLTKRYGPVTAVDDVSFKAERGEILGFLGPNGAGKTTTMRVLTGYMPATDGKAIVAGYDVLEQPVEAKRRTGYLPETPPLYPDMTVSDYLAFCARIKGVPRSERATRLKTVMERTQIADVANRHCSKLSKGYRQRVGLAQALLHNPEVLILDEPTAGLDPKQIIETRRLIKGLGGDHTIILSTHILPEVSQTCNRIVIINKGRVVAVDTPANLTARLRGSETLYVQVDSMGADAEGMLSSIPGVTRVSNSDRHDSIAGYEVDSESGRDVRRELASAVVGRGWGLLELRPMRMGLEEIFLKVITEDAAVSDPAVSDAAASDAAPEASRE
jgi:gliding motility-associated transport system ATP-binding protein